MGDVKPEQRYSRTRPCPVCGGYDGGKRGAGHGPLRHCHGFLSTDGRYARCSRLEYTADAPYDEKTSTWVHRLEGGDAARTASYGASDGQRRIVATYDYRDEAGDPLFQAVRYLPKGFKQRRPDGAGGWVWNLKGVRLIPYRLPELRAADPAATVYVVEGEKDAENLRALGYVATCNAMGAGKWRAEYSEHLRGRHVVILPDGDKAGTDHARTVASALDGIAASVKVLELPGLPRGGDVSDWLTGGGTSERLTGLADATRDYVASEHPPPRDTGEWTPKITLLSDVTPEQVRWLWPGYIPLGKLTVIDGDPGNGKSTVMCDIAARVSTWRAMPDGTSSDLEGPAGVVLLSAEDGPADTIRPRLDAAAADVARVALLECAVSGERERGITLADLDHIEAAIATVNAALVVVDPLMAFLGGDTNSLPRSGHARGAGTIGAARGSHRRGHRRDPPFQQGADGERALSRRREHRHHRRGARRTGHRARSRRAGQPAPRARRREEQPRHQAARDGVPAHAGRERRRVRFVGRGDASHRRDAHGSTIGR